MEKVSLATRVRSEIFSSIWPKASVRDFNLVQYSVIDIEPFYRSQNLASSWIVRCSLLSLKRFSMLIQMVRAVEPRTRTMARTSWETDA